MSLLSLVACNNIPFETEAERVARQRQQVLVDSAQDARQHLGQLLSLSQDTLPADRQVNDYYRHDGSWIWVGTDTTLLLHDADTLARYLQRQATEMGFSPKAFLADSILHDIEHFRLMDFDSTGISPTETMARLELNISRAYSRYAQGQHYGFVNPHQLLNHLDAKPGGFRTVYDIDIEQPDSDFVSQALRHAHDGHPIEYLQTCEPNDNIYRQLKTKLVTDSSSMRERILSNMERLRWRHKKQIDRKSRHIFVNIPSQQLWAIAPDSTFSMRICCGAWKTKTPLLNSAIRLIQLNPEWNIPFSIMRDEVSHHAGDSSYFARNRYFIIRRSTGDTVSAKHVTADQIRAGQYRIAQRSGARNSLGRLIFRFPNQFDVYLHDTNNHSAFNAERRTISHGCVRVERPYDLALFLIPDADEWLIDRMRISIDMRPLSERGKTYMQDHADDAQPLRPLKSVDVTPNIPVLIDYYTYYPNPETGVWETWRDRYEYDQQIMLKIKPFLP